MDKSEQNKQHKYPLNRKNRDTSYSVTFFLENEYGLKEVYELWTEMGMYKTASYLSKELHRYVSPYTIRYMSNKHGWIREIDDQSLPIYIAAVELKTVPEDFYKHIKFKKEESAYVP